MPASLRGAAGTPRLLAGLVAIVLAAFAFGYAMVPLYDVFCRLTGLNGKTAATPATWAATGAVKVDRARLITVEFTGMVMPGLDWTMQPGQTRLTLHPGELQTAHYVVSNRSLQAVTGRAVPSVSPPEAARHFQKIECFCFKEQALAPGERREMPLTFVIAPELAPDVRRITLSYAFFNARP